MVLVRPEENQNLRRDGDQQASIKVKTPKRVLHFCDGTLEEYSTDEEVEEPPKRDLVDPTTLAWGPWMWYKAWAAGASTLAVMDSMGEYLAALFGITTPRYYFELEEYKRREEENKKRDEEAKGWSQPASSVNVPLNDISKTQPKPVEV